MNSAGGRDVAQELALPLVHLFVGTKLDGAERRQRRAGKQGQDDGLFHPKLDLCLVVVAVFHRGQGQCRSGVVELSTSSGMFHVEHFERLCPCS